MVEEIALAPLLTQKQDDEDFNTKKLPDKSDNIQYQRGKVDVFTRIFSSKKCLKQLILWIILFIILFLIAGPLALHISYSKPAIKSRNIAGHVFSEERARDYLTNLTQYGSRVSNTRGKFYARNFLITQIKRIYSMSKRHLQFEIDLQNFTTIDHNQLLQNIIVRVSNPLTKYKNPPSVMLSAHYDSVEFSPGASDDGSGVAILLELLSNLINDLTITFSDVQLIILFTDGEEMGLEGAAAFIMGHRWHYNIRRFISVDSVSCNEMASLIQVSSSQLIIDYSRVSRPRANIILEKIVPWLGLTTDYDMYSQYGSLLGYNFGSFLDGYTYHTSLDDISTIKKGVLQDLGENLCILTRNILVGDTQLMVNDPMIYFDILSRYLIVYKMSTSIIIQQILIILIIIVGIFLVIFDEICHRQRSIRCINCDCIYVHLKYPFLIRIITIIVYFISNLTSVLVGILFSMIIALILTLILPFSWFGNSTLSIFLLSFPCLIGFIINGYLWNMFHSFILRKSPKNSFGLNPTKHVNEINFDFEQNLSVLLVYVVLMIISIVSKNRLFYLILVWSIFICPISLVLMIIEFIIHWKQIQWNLFKERYHWFYIPLMISVFPLTHTIEIVNRLVRIFIPICARRYLIGQRIRGNILICSFIVVPTIFFILVVIPILQRIKYFGRILILLLITFVIIFIVSLIRQPFTNIHPNAFYAKHVSKSIFKVNSLSNVSFNVPLLSQSSSITVTTFNGFILSRLLDQFTVKSGYILQNKQYFSRTNCTFDDTFNRKIAVENIKIESSKDFPISTIIVQHVLSYNIQILSSRLNQFVVRDQLNLPRTETIIDVISHSTLFPFDIDIKINRCDLNDSPFLLLFTRLMPHIVLMGDAQCQAIEDNTKIIIESNTLFHQ